MSDSNWPTPIPRRSEAELAGEESVFAVAASPQPTAGAHQVGPVDRSGPSVLPRAPRRVSLLGWIGVAAIAAWLMVMPLVSTATQLQQNTKAIVMVLAVLGVNLATGYGGMISLGHGVFVAVGSFATAYAAADLGLPWAVSILAGSVLAGAVGAVVGLPTLRIKGIYLALVTLGLAIVFQPLSKRMAGFTGGVSGRTVDAEMTAPVWFGTSRWSDVLYRYVICVTVVAVALWLVYRLVDSRPGRAMRAVRDDDTAAAVYGVNLVTTRLATFAISAAIAGLAGGLLVVLVPFASQESFPPQESLVLYATAVLGGLGSIWGSVLGVVIREVAANAGSGLASLDGLGALSEVFDLLDDERLLFGVALIALTFVFPAGLTSAMVGRIRR